MNRRDAVLPIPTAIAAVAQKLKANPTAAGPHDIVRQAELQEVIDLQNRVEVLSANIRRRLEAGAEFERGELGASTWDREPLESIAIGDATQADGFGILDIGPADRLRQLRDDEPALADHIWA